MKSTYPTERIPFNEWCKMFNVSSRYEPPEPKENANRIMSLWDGYINDKKKYIKKLSFEETKQ